MLPLSRPARGGLALVLAAAALGQARSACAQGTYDIDDLMPIHSVSEYAWSPDGRFIYYISTAGSTGVAEIFRIPAQGGQPTQLTDKLVPEFKVTPIADRPEPKADLEVSPDGRRIFFTSARYFQNMDNIYSIAADGSDVRQHTWHDAVIETAPAVSPDGKTLAFFDRRPRGTKIYLLDLENPKAWPRLFAPGNLTERDPVWSPDGKSLLFTRNGEIWIQAVEGGEPRRLVEPGYSISSAVWSPDGTKVAVTSTASGFSQIGIVDVATGKLTPLTYRHRGHSTPAWSPDGRMLVFTVDDGLGLSNQVAIMPADGSSEPRLLTTGPGTRRAPRFSPDGREITYLESTTTRTSDIWAIP